MSKSPSTQAQSIDKLAGNRHRGLRSPDQHHQSRERTRRRHPKRPVQEVRRHTRRDLSTVVHRPGRGADYDLEQGAAAERLSARDDVQVDAEGDFSGKFKALHPRRWTLRERLWC